MQCVASLPTADADADDRDGQDVGRFDFDDGLDAHTMVLDPPFTATQLTPRIAEQAAPAFVDHALPDGTLIEGFQIVRKLGEGGFGIVYLAWDAALERHVAIKEYMPCALAVRVQSTMRVSMRTERDRDTFDIGLKSFVNEARLLARFDHPALVKVFRFWEANSTAYMAMPFYEGPTLAAALAAFRGPVPEAQLREWLHPLLDALTVLHRENCYHRDISPDNILLTSTGPLLLDFGAARRVISDRTQALTTMLKPGFAPIEQYGGSLMQGPWTDLYALAGVVHYAIAGRTPLASVVRVVKDTLRPLAVSHADRYSATFLQAIDAALAIRPEARPQDVAQFRALLGVDRAADRAAPTLTPTATATTKSTSTSTSTSTPTPTPTPTSTSTLAPEKAQSSTAAPSMSPAGPASAGRSPKVAPASTARVSAQSSESAPAVRKVPWLQALVACAVLLAVCAIGWLGIRSETKPVPSTAPTATIAQPAAPTPLLPSPAEAPPVPVPVLVPIPVPVAARALAPKQETLPAATAVQAPEQVQPAVSAAVATMTSPPRPSRSSANRNVGQPAAERVKAAVVALPTSASTTRTAQRSEENVAPSYAEKSRPPRCGDLVLKSSLESLNPEEFAYLKRECR